MKVKDEDVMDCPLSLIQSVPFCLCHSTLQQPFPSHLSIYLQICERQSLFEQISPNNKTREDRRIKRIRDIHYQMRNLGHCKKKMGMILKEAAT